MDLNNVLCWTIMQYDCNGIEVLEAENLDHPVTQVSKEHTKIHFIVMIQLQPTKNSACCAHVQQKKRSILPSIEKNLDSTLTSLDYANLVSNIQGIIVCCQSHICLLQSIRPEIKTPINHPTSHKTNEKSLFLKAVSN